ncbi:hypothetical protein N9937_00295 [bacterium]|nr:hypothetical protein [bacterium]
MSTKLKVGVEVKLTRAHSTFKDGTIGIIQEVDTSDDTYKVRNSEDYNWVDFDRVVPTGVVYPLLKDVVEGNEYKLTMDLGCDAFTKGTKVKLLRNDGSNLPYKIENELTDTQEWVYPYQLKEINHNKGKKMNKTEEKRDPIGTAGNVFRIEVLYTDNTHFNVGGIQDFRFDSETIDGADAFEYTKQLNDDVEGTVKIRKADVAALILRFDNGKTSIYEFSDKVVDKVKLRMQNKTNKAVKTEKVKAPKVKKAKKKVDTGK